MRARIRVLDGDRRTARALAWCSAMLPHMKRPPTLKAFVGETSIDEPRPVQSGGEIVCVMDQWRFATVTMDGRKAARPGPRKKPKPPKPQE